MTSTIGEYQEIKGNQKRKHMMLLGYKEKLHKGGDIFEPWSSSPESQKGEGHSRHRGKNVQRSRNLIQQALTEIQYITQCLSKFTLRETLLKMRPGNEQRSCLISYVMFPNRNSCYKNCLYQSRLATCIQWGFLSKITSGWPPTCQAKKWFRVNKWSFWHSFIWTKNAWNSVPWISLNIDTE